MMNRKEVCVISNIDIFGPRVLISIGPKTVCACRAAFLGKAPPILLRFSGVNDLSVVPGIEAPVNFLTKEIRGNVTGWDVESFLNRIPRSWEGLSNWKRQVVGAMMVFGPEVRDFAAQMLEVEVDSVTEHDRSMGQFGRPVEAPLMVNWYSATCLDAAAKRYAPPTIYPRQRL